MRARYLLLPSPCQPGLVSNGKSHLGRWILRTRQVESRIATYKLHGVAANGLTICACVIVYTMLYVIKSGGIVGGGGTIIKSILTHFTLFIFLIIVK
jgi:hypothetical protein